MVRAVPPLHVATIRDVLASDGEIEWLFDELETYVARHGARANEPPLTVYHDAEYRERDLDVEVAVPVSRALPGGERVRVGELAGVATMACAVHAGSYATIAGAAQALLTWIGSNGFHMAGPLREVYLRFGATGLPFALPAIYLAGRAEDFVTELQVPIAAT